MANSDSLPEQLLMEANIKEFGHRISLICALESGGKISPEQAYAMIKQVWKELKVSRKSLTESGEPPTV